MNIDQDPILKQIVQKLSDEFHPRKIYLFGSRAANVHGPRSDYDLLVLVDHSDRRPIQRMQVAHQVLFSLHAPVDVFVYTQAEFDKMKDEFGSIANTVATDGLELRVG